MYLSHCIQINTDMYLSDSVVSKFVPYSPNKLVLFKFYYMQYAKEVHVKKHDLCHFYLVS